MRERNAVLIIMLVLFVLGLVNLAFFSIYSKFNFNRAELAISGNNVQEKLYYIPDKPYHTLFRTFSSPAYANMSTSSVSPYTGEKGYILTNSVNCQTGEAYVYSQNGFYTMTSDSLIPASRLSYTEPNEYGCTFGDMLGFAKGQNYWISSSYSVYSPNLFLIKGKYYTKFIAYSPDSHKLLIRGSNFFVSGDIVTKSIFLPGDYVLIYIPYSGDISGFTIISRNNFEFDNSFRNLIIIAFIPPIIFFLLWFLLGRESSFKDLPSTLSYFPKNRKAWEVASYFQPPFSVADQEFFSSTILDFKRRKIIDLKEEEKEVYIKINEASNLDIIEKRFYDFLGKIEALAKPENKKAGYFNLNRTLKQWFTGTGIRLSYKALEIDKGIKEEGKEYIDDKMKYITPTFFILIFILIGFGMQLFFIFSSVEYFIFPAIYSIATLLLVTSNSALLIHFKKDYYAEYQQWQAFRAYLKSFPSMKNSPPEAVRLWDIYLVYAAALGVSKQVLKAFKNWGVINEKQFNTFSTSIVASNSLGASSGSSGSHGGGFGGAGGGGAGGGGGGGR